MLPTGESWGGCADKSCSVDFLHHGHSSPSWKLGNFLETHNYSFTIVSQQLLIISATGSRKIAM